MLSYTDSASAREVKGSVARRGLCGDVFLMSTPAGPRLRETRARPSVRNRTCTFEAEVETLAPDGTYRLLARVLDHNSQLKRFEGPLFGGDQLARDASEMPSASG